MIIGRLERDAHYIYASPLPTLLLQTKFGREGDDERMDATTSF
jgi:hypothetical protein